MKTLWLIRHGRVVGDAHRRFLGRTDLPMSGQGEAEIAAVAARLAAEPLDLILASDLARSRRTAEILAAGRAVPIRVEPALREIDMGDWEMRERDEIARLEPEAWRARGGDIARFRPPGGESFADVAARLAPLVATLRADGAPDHVAVTGHAGVDRVLLTLLLDLPLDRLFAFAEPHGAVHRLDVEGHGIRIAPAFAPSEESVRLPLPISRDRGPDGARR